MRRQVLVRGLSRSARQPGVDENFVQPFLRESAESQEQRCVAVEVRNREEEVWLRPEKRFLLAEILGGDREDGTVGYSSVAEALEVRLAERAFPREPFPATNQVRFP